MVRWSHGAALILVLTPLLHAKALAESQSSEIGSSHTMPDGASDRPTADVPGATPPDDIGANFYPRRGLYSTKDPQVLDEHMDEIFKAGIGVVVFSWWRKGWGSEGVETDSASMGVLDAAARRGLSVAFHLEPYDHRTVRDVRADVEYIMTTYGGHKAFYRDDAGRPLFYCYDSYRLPVTDWAELLTSRGKLSVRGTSLDGTYLGLYLKRGNEGYATEGGFDGFYTYFASQGMSDGSRLSEWPRLVAWAREHKKIFVPCVGPGYDDTRIRPWNDAARKAREGGSYYDVMWDAALRSQADIVAVTSYNEWSEGTQIEPASQRTGSKSGFQYQGYAGSNAHAGSDAAAADMYINLTRKWVDKLISESAGRKQKEETALLEALKRQDLGAGSLEEHEELRKRSSSLYRSRTGQSGEGGGGGGGEGRRKACGVCYSTANMPDRERQGACSACSGEAPDDPNTHAGSGVDDEGDSSLMGHGDGVGQWSARMQSDFEDLRREVLGLLDVLQALREQEIAPTATNTQACSNAQGDCASAKDVASLQVRTGHVENGIEGLRQQMLNEVGALRQQMLNEVGAFRLEIKKEAQARAAAATAAESAIREIGGQLSRLVEAVGASSKLLHQATAK